MYRLQYAHTKRYKRNKQLSCAIKQLFHKIINNQSNPFIYLLSNTTNAYGWLYRLYIPSSTFWTTRGHRYRSLSARVRAFFFVVQRVQQSRCSSICIAFCDLALSRFRPAIFGGYCISVRCARVVKLLALIASWGLAQHMDLPPIKNPRIFARIHGPARGLHHEV